MFRTNATANLPLRVKNAKDNGKNCRACSNPSGGNASCTVSFGSAQSKVLDP